MTEREIKAREQAVLLAWEQLQEALDAMPDEGSDTSTSIGFVGIMTIDKGDNKLGTKGAMVGDSDLLANGFAVMLEEDPEFQKVMAHAIRLSLIS